jgi:hypothetical protein
MWAAWLELLFAMPLSAACLFVDQARDGVALVTDGELVFVSRAADAREADRSCPGRPQAVFTPLRAVAPRYWRLTSSGDADVR